VWAWDAAARDLDSRFWDLVRHTFMLGAIAGLALVSMALLVAFGLRLKGRHQDGLQERVAGLGYSLPGSVLAVGIMTAFAFIDREVINPVQVMMGLEPHQVLVGSLSALLVAYVVRFFSVAYGPVRDSLERIRPGFQEAAHMLGANHVEVLRRIYLPLLTPGLLSALLLVLVDTMKEMPATLLLRPFGWDTLAVRVYEMTSEGEWQRAALPALVLVLISIPPVILMIRRSRL
jgi:iron(III) transport system permease protein